MSVYFLNSFELAQRAIAGKMSNKEKINHYFFFILFSSFFQGLIVILNSLTIVSSNSIPKIVGYLLLIPAAIIGVSIVYSVNNSIDGKNVLERISIIGLPATIKSGLISCSLFLLLSFFDWKIFHMVAEMILIPFFHLMIFIFIALSMKKPSKKKVNRLLFTN